MRAGDLWIGAQIAVLLLFVSAGAQQCDDIFTDGEGVVSASVLSSVDSDVQKIVDCIGPNGELVFDASLDVKLTGLVVLNQPITLKGKGKGNKRSSFTCSKKGVPAFEIASPGIEFQNLVIQGCNLDSNVTASVIIDAPVPEEESEEREDNPISFLNVEFSNNKNENGTGGVYIGSAESVRFERTLFKENSGEYGGALTLDSTGIKASFVNCIFEENYANLYGGAINQNLSAVLTITDGKFLKNEAIQGGGALHIKGEPPQSKTTLLRTEFRGNTALKGQPPTLGGAIYAKGPRLKIDIVKCNFTENLSAFQGGAVYLSDSRRPGNVVANIEDVKFERNAAHFGGALRVLSLRRRMNITITGSAFLSNVGTLQNRHLAPIEVILAHKPLDPGRGGAIYCHGSRVRFVSEGNLFESNVATSLGGPGQAGPEGGAIFLSDITAANFKDDEFKNNSAITERPKGLSGVAGAIYIEAQGVDIARVSGAPPNSDCADQCDLRFGAEVGFVNIRDGCSQLGANQDLVCVLTNPEVCDEFDLKIFRLSEDEDAITAACEVDKSNTSAIFSNVKFKENVADGDGGALLVAEKSVDVILESGVEFTGNKARGGNGGAILIASGARISASVTEFTSNKGSEGGAVSMKGGSFNSEGSIFKENKAVDGSGGAIHVEGRGSKIKATRLPTFSRNGAADSGGAIGISGTDHSIEIIEPLFKENSAKRAGGALIAKSFSGDTDVKLVDASFLDNFIAGSETEQNVKFGVGGAIAAYGAGVSLFITGKENKFDGNLAREGGAIRTFDTHLARIENTTFEENAALSGGAVHVTFTSKSEERLATIHGVKFERNTAFVGGGLMVDAKNANESFIPNDGLAQAVFLESGIAEALTIQLDMKDVEFLDQKTVQDGGGMSLVDIHATCSACSFTRNKVDKLFNGNGGGFKLSELAVFELSDGIVDGNSAVSGGGISLDNSVLIATNITVIGNSATELGGGISVSAFRNLGAHSLTLKESSVMSNRAKFGGGVYLSILEQEILTSCTANATQIARMSVLPRFDQILTLVSDVCTAENQGNTAVGNDIEEFYPTGLVLVDATIDKNFANSAGGGLFTTDVNALCICCGKKCSPNCQAEGSVSLLNVCADSWGSNAFGKGGYGHMMASTETDSLLFGPSFSLVNEGDVFEMNHPSGEPLQEMSVEIKDAFEQTVTIGNDVFVRVESENNEILSGQVYSKVDNGLARFDRVIVRAKPSEYDLMLTFTSPIEIKPRRLKMIVRNCTRGEKEVAGTAKSDFSCVKCIRKQYLFDPKGNCTDCPTDAECDGRSIIPDPGFWHSTSWSPQIHQCLFKQACDYHGRSEKMVEESWNATSALRYDEGYSQCKKGYEGILCGSCSPDYGRLRAFECEKCGSRSSAMLILIAGAIWFLLVTSFLVWKALGAAKNVDGTSVFNLRGLATEESINQSDFGVPRHEPVLLGVNPVTENAKILLNFLQVTSIAVSINVEWRQEVQDMLSLQDILSGFSSDNGIFSMDCPLSNDSSVPIAIRRTFISLLVPLGYMLFFCILWLTVTVVKKRDSEFFRTHVLVSVIVVVYVFYTGITKRVMRTLHRVDLDDPYSSEFSIATKSYWADDTSILFLKGSHAYLVGLLGIPMLLVFSIGFPLLLSFELWMNKEHRNSRHFASTYGFLYRAYQERFVYWEMVVLARKAMLVAVVVFAYDLGGNLQGILALMVLVFAMVLHLCTMPYDKPVDRLNQRETLSLCGSTFTYFVGILFNDKNLPHWAEILLSVIAIFLSGFIVAYLLITLALEGAQHLDTLLKDRKIPIPAGATTRKKAILLADSYWKRSMNILWRVLDSKDGKEENAVSNREDGCT